MSGRGRAHFQSAGIRPRVEQALGEAVLRLKGEEASLWCLSDEGDRMELAVNIGPTPGLLEALAVPVTESVVGLVQATRMAMTLGPGEQHHVEVDRVSGVKTRAMAACCLFGAGGVLGVISVINPLGRERFQGEDLVLLGQVALDLSSFLETGHD